MQKTLIISCLALLITLASGLPFLCPVVNLNNNINCSIDTHDYSSSKLTVPSQIKVVAYNLDSNGYGGDSPLEKGLQPIIDLFSATGPLNNTDVIVFSELARDCINSNYSNGAQEIAQALGYFYAYAVEYLMYENAYDQKEHQCTSGNAIVSKYPITDVTQYRFKHQCCIFPFRIGGRVSIQGALTHGNTPLYIYSEHLESGQNSITKIVEGFFTRYGQSYELRAFAEKNNQTNVLLAGDFNSPAGDSDPLTFQMTNHLYADTFAELPYSERNTCPFDELSKNHLYVFDYLFLKSNGQVTASQPVIYNQQVSQQCYGLSDHYPISIKLTFN